MADSAPAAEIAALLDRWWRDEAVFFREAFGVEGLPWQIRVLRLARRNKRVTVRSPRGVGKTAELAVLVLDTLLQTGGSCRVPCVAPVQASLRDILWPEIRRWHKRLSDRWPLLGSWIEIKADRVVAGSDGFAQARTARKENPESMQGFNHENLLFLIDEASGVPEEIFTAIEGSLSQRGSRIFLSSNPTRLDGYFYDTQMSDDLAALWKRVHVRLEDGPPTRDAAEFARSMAAKFGESSNIYRVHVLGEFPLNDPDSFIPFDWVSSAVGRDVSDTGGRVIWGLDVGTRGLDGGGGDRLPDRSSLAKRRGNRLLEKIKAWRGLDEMQTAGRVLIEYQEAEVKPDTINVDVIGVGSGVVARLKELGLPAVGVNVAESAPTQEKYYKLRDELWGRAREWFERRDCVMPEDDDFLGEITTVKWGKPTSDGKTLVERKVDMKKRLKHSPDLADAFCLTFASSDMVSRGVSYWSPDVAM